MQLDELTIIDYLAIATILAEAGNQQIEGMIAVGEVIRNRAKRKYNSNGSIIGTILHPWQFSCWNNDFTNRPLMISRLNRIALPNQDQWDSNSVKALGAWGASEISNITDGSVLYHTIHVAPSWSLSPKIIKKVQIGSHIFYDEVG